MSNWCDARCPKCGSEDKIDVVSTVWTRLTIDGDDPDEAGNHDHEYDDASTTRCNACEHYGTLGEFKGRTT